MRIGRAVSRLRTELGQVSWFAKRLSARRVATKLRVARRMSAPLPRPGSAPGTVWGVSVVRDEADVIEATIAHLLDQGIDHLLIADNGSADGTAELLTWLSAHDDRIHVAEDHEPRHFQSEKITHLAFLAWLAGAHWVLPFDADEFFFAAGCTVGEFLAGSELSVVHADFHHMVPTAATRQVGTSTEFILDSTPAWPGKIAARSHPLLDILPGNHGAARVGVVGPGLFVAHAIYRSPEQLARKFRHGMAAAPGDDGTVPGEHWQRGSRLTDAEIAEVWDNVSHGRPEPRIDYAAAGPMVAVKPLEWRHWDPSGLLPNR